MFKISKSETGETTLNMYLFNVKILAFSPFLDDVLLQCTLKISENQRLSDVFRWYWRWTLVWNELILQAPTPQNSQTHSNNLSAIANELLECVWPFCGLGIYRVNCLITDPTPNIAATKYESSSLLIKKN